MGCVFHSSDRVYESLRIRRCSSLHLKLPDKKSSLNNNDKDKHNKDNATSSNQDALDDGKNRALVESSNDDDYSVIDTHSISSMPFFNDENNKHSQSQPLERVNTTTSTKLSSSTTSADILQSEKELLRTESNSSQQMETLETTSSQPSTDNTNTTESTNKLTETTPETPSPLSTDNTSSITHTHNNSNKITAIIHCSYYLWWSSFSVRDWAEIDYPLKIHSFEENTSQYNGDIKWTTTTLWLFYDSLHNTGY